MYSLVVRATRIEEYFSVSLFYPLYYFLHALRQEPHDKEWPIDPPTPQTRSLVD